MLHGPSHEQCPDFPSQHSKYIKLLEDKIFEMIRSVPLKNRHNDFSRQYPFSERKNALFLHRCLVSLAVLV